MPKLRHQEQHFSGYDHVSVRARSRPRGRDENLPTLGCSYGGSGIGRGPRVGPLEVDHMKQVVAIRGLEDRLNRMEAHHRALDERLEKLRRRPHLTPKEQLEIAELKKHKLRAKDEIAALRASL